MVDVHPTYIPVEYDTFYLAPTPGYKEIFLGILKPDLHSVTIASITEDTKSRNAPHGS